MTQFAQVHVVPAAGEALEALGWQASDPWLKDLVPAIARGQSATITVPHAPAYAGPALAALASRLATHGGRALVLVPAAEVAAWSALAAAVTAGTTVRTEAAHGSARAQRRLREGTLDLLVASPDTAQQLHRRAALKADGLAAIVIAWPEQLRGDADEAVAGLLADVPAEAQRLLITADAMAAAPFVERYARKALAFGVVPGESPSPREVRTVTVGWDRRVAAIADLVELLDPPALTVWTADRAEHDAIRRALPANDAAIRVVCGAETASGTIIAFDLPSAERLAGLAAEGDVVLLVPVEAEATAAKLASKRRSVRLPGLLEQATAAAATRRATIQQTLGGDTRAALSVLAPLFERYDPAAVAAALYELWTADGARALPPVASAPGATAAPAAESLATAKIFVGVGKKDGATVNDLVAVLTKEVKVDRTKVGKVELRDAFALIEVPAADAERIASALSGMTIRRRRITARVDRDRPTSGAGSRGGAGARGGARPPARGGPRRPGPSR